MIDGSHHAFDELTGHGRRSTSFAPSDDASPVNTTRDYAHEHVVCRMQHAFGALQRLRQRQAHGDRFDALNIHGGSVRGRGTPPVSSLPPELISAKFLDPLPEFAAVGLYR